MTDQPGYGNFQQGLQAMGEGEFSDAEDFFKKALQLEPMNPEYHFELANLYALQHDESDKIDDELGAQQRMQLAQNELEQAVMARPSFVAAHYNLGVVYKKLGEYEKARKEFKEVLRLDASQASAMMQIGATYEEQGFYDEAETIYSDLREQYPEKLELRDAIDDLDKRREQARVEESQNHAARMNMLNASLSQFSPQANTYGNPGNSYQQPSSGLGQAIPFLGQWALQQFMQRKTSNEG